MLKKKNKNNVLIVGGDFNVPDIDWPTLTIKGSQYPDRTNKDILDIVRDNVFEQIVNFPTRKTKTLDLILTTHPSFSTRCKSLPSLGKSDHDIVLYDTTLTPFRPRLPRRKLYLWGRADTVAIKKDLHEYAKSIETDPALHFSVDTMWNNFKEKMHEVMEKHVPSKLSCSKYSHPWMNSKLRRSIRQKQRAHVKMKNTGKKRDSDRYRRLQAEVNYDIKQASKNHLEKVVSEDFFSAPKKFWAYVKSRGNESCGVSPLRDKEGYLKSDSTSKADILNKQFQSAFTKEDTLSMPSKGQSCFVSMDDIDINEKGILKLLRDLKPNKATGPDSIPARLLKTGAEELSPVLTKLFQLSLDQGHVPKEWKEAWVTPIFKKGDKHQPANYRPVSLTSIVCKVLEHVIHSNIMRHLDQRKILTNAQHGFRKARSCETQLLVTVHDIANSLADGDQVDAILLDFSKAFDKVPHQRLLHKLQYYGVRGTTLSWIESFLVGRTQQVALEGIFSSTAAVTSGVPQGTVLGPLLFLIYINDLPDVVKHSAVRLFADDSLLHRKIKTDRDQVLLQQDLDSLAKWESMWQMAFNPSKCNTIHIQNGKRKHPRLFDYILHGQKLESVTSSKYLGVTISNDFTWTRHIENVAARGNQTVGFLRRNFRECAPKAKTATYTAIVRPALEYASAVWDPHQEQDKKPLEKVQRRAARYVFNNYTQRTPGTVTTMLNTLKWESLETRRRNIRLTLLYKIKNSLVDINAATYITSSDTRTRGAERLRQEHVQHPALANQFFPRTVSQWNKLSPETTSAPSLESFHSRLGSTLLLSGMGAP
jgi:hypothetical protein